MQFRLFKSNLLINYMCNDHLLYYRHGGKHMKLSRTISDDLQHPKLILLIQDNLLASILLFLAFIRNKNFW